MKDDALDRLLRTRLKLVAFPEFGGMRLWLAHPGSRLGDLVRRHDAGTPYWGFVWPGGLGLCRYLFEHPEVVRDRRVLDFGAGSGLVGIAAHLCGAKGVGFGDSDPLASAACRLNAAENGLVPIDFAEMAPGPGDVVLAGDVFYDPGAARDSLARLTAFAGAGAEGLIGDPFRPDLPLDRLVELARTEVHEVGTAAQSSGIAAGIFRLVPAADGA